MHILTIRPSCLSNNGRPTPKVQPIYTSKTEESESSAITFDCADSQPPDQTIAFLRLQAIVMIKMIDHPLRNQIGPLLNIGTGGEGRHPLPTSECRTNIYPR